jgi:hypothetical protein
MYRAGQRRKNQRRKKLVLLAACLLLVIGAGFTGLYLKNKLQPKTVVKQARATTKQVSYEKTKTHYDEANFGIDLPSTWQKVPSPTGPYTTYNWQVSNKGTDGQQITIFEDTIPVNFAVNRVLIVEPQGDTVTTKGSASENCSTFTKGVSPTANQVGAPAKWQGIDFLCDQANQGRDVIGTSSKDGVNKVVLKSQTTGRSFTYLFSYTNHSINPDYTAFYDAINSFRLK